MSQDKGNRMSLVQPQEAVQAHPFYPTLRQWVTYGAPVNFVPDWEWGVIKQSISQGPHCSALEPENVATVK